MKITLSYAVEIRNRNKLLMPTVRIFHDAVTYCVEKFEKEWSEINLLRGKDKNNFCEKLLHSTSKNKAKYNDFDTKFYKMPCYLRRNAIAVAIGSLESYHSNLNNWEQNGCKGRKPAFQKHLHKTPTFYKDNMYLEDSADNDVIQLKLFINNDWNWVSVKLRHTDMEYIRRCKGKKSNPTLERKNKKWFLRFAFSTTAELNKTKISEQRVLAVDLGMNTDAVCCVMNASGTVLARKFINFASEKDCLYHTLNKIKRMQKEQNSSHNTTKLWRYAKFHNVSFAQKVAKAISDYAYEQKVNVIVFEHLDMKGKKSGRRKERLQMWRKNDIQNIVKNKAHLYGIRISRICAYNTSKLAYDGSGTVKRSKKNYSVCVFASGKRYHCDLSASYNIGARYFIRELQKTIPVREWSDIQAKVPDVQKRTQCTLSTLLAVNKAI